MMSRRVKRFFMCERRGDYRTWVICQALIPPNSACGVHAARCGESWPTTAIANCWTMKNARQAMIPAATSLATWRRMVEQGMPFRRSQITFVLRFQSAAS